MEELSGLMEGWNSLGKLTLVQLKQIGRVSAGEGVRGLFGELDQFLKYSEILVVKEVSKKT